MIGKMWIRMGCLGTDFLALKRIHWGVLRLGCRVAQLVKCLATSGYPDGSRSGGPGFKSRWKREFLENFKNYLRCDNCSIKKELCCVHCRRTLSTGSIVDCRRSSLSPENVNTLVVSETGWRITQQLSCYTVWQLLIVLSWCFGQQLKKSNVVLVDLFHINFNQNYY